MITAVFSLLRKFCLDAHASLRQAEFSREKDLINKKAAMLRKASPLLVASFARS